MKFPNGKRRLTLLLVALLAPWAIAALWLNPEPTWMRAAMVAGYGATSLALVYRIKNALWRLAIWVTLNGFVIAFFLELEPRDAQTWAIEDSRMPKATLAGERATISDVRNFTYRTETDFIARWEIREVDIDQIMGADLFLTHWGVPLVAHSILSFRFANGTYLATSIEARRTSTQKFSAFQGFFRVFQVIYLIADERDVVRLRTNFRHEEKVYLYRTRLGAADARALFRRYLGWMNSAREHPEWYNAFTKNCSSPITSYLADAKVGGISRWDWRGILDGNGDKMLYELGDLSGDNLPFDELKHQALIAPTADIAESSERYSQHVREGRPGFGN